MQYYKVYFEGEEEEFAHRINIRTIHTHSYNDRWGKIHVKDTFVKNEWKWHVVLNLLRSNEHLFFHASLHFRVHPIFIKINVCIKSITDVTGALASQRCCSVAIKFLLRHLIAWKLFNLMFQMDMLYLKVSYSAASQACGSTRENSDGLFVNTPLHGWKLDQYS